MTALLLKIKQEALADEVALVPKMKSARLSHDDPGKLVFIWLDNTADQKSRLYGVATLQSVAEVEIPQVRNPNRSKPAYRLCLSGLSTDVSRALKTDDLEEHRYSQGNSGLERLGKLHRDRNDKIIALTSEEANELSDRFNTRSSFS